MNLSSEHQKLLNKYNNFKKLAQNNPNKLVKLSAGSYMFYSSLENILLLVDDDSYERGGSPDWVIRQESDNNVLNTYETLKAFKKDWIK